MLIPFKIICNFFISLSCLFRAATFLLSISWNFSSAPKLAALASISAFPREELEKCGDFPDLRELLLRLERFE